MPGAATYRQWTTIAERQQYVADAYLKGAYQSQIARELGVDRSLISLDLKALREQWRESALRDFDEAKAQELAKVDQVEAAAWGAWEKSLTPHIVSTRERTLGDFPSRKVQRRREVRCGDPRFLQIIQKCVDQRCDILGLKAPTKFKIDWASLSDEQLQRLAAGDDPQQVIAGVVAEA